MKTVRVCIGRVLILFALVFSTASFAQAAAPQVGGPAWACWYQASDLSISCLLSRAPIDDFAARARQVARAIDKRLAGLVRTIWGSPEQLAGKRVSIPLWNAPYEMDFARQLAEAVMCGRRADCTVNFDHNPDGRAALRAAAVMADTSEDDVLAELAAQGLELAAAVPAAGAEVNEVAAVAERRSTRRRRVING